MEALLRELDVDSNRVIAYLKSFQNLLALAAKHGHPSRDDCARYLKTFAYDEEHATLLLKRIWALTNPKPPKPPKKGPPKEHLAAKCAAAAPRPDAPALALLPPAPGCHPLLASPPYLMLPPPRPASFLAPPGAASPRAPRPSGRCSTSSRSSTRPRRSTC